jgi:hypothetical protein
MKKFEYKLLRVPLKNKWTAKVNEALLITNLNELGKQGWEIAVSSPSDVSTTDRFIILKKEIN